MKIIINSANSTINSDWQEFKKVRAIIKNNKNEYVITKESGKIIFPGGQKENDEDDITAIKRELLEEFGVNFSDKELQQVLEIETFYEEYYDFRIDKQVPRHTTTTYFYIKTDKEINFNNQSLTQNEINQDFKIFFVSKQELINKLLEDHSDAYNGTYFDQENKIILEEIIEKH